MGGAMNFGSKINLAFQQLVLFLLALMIVFNFLAELKKAKKRNKKHYLKITLRNWWNGYENFIYPLLVINESPVYFLAIIGISQLFYLYNSLTVPHYKALAILKALYPICFHSCFIIFFCSKD
jgi:hypothetical protein